VLSQALNVTEDKIESKGIKSVRARVTNIRPYMQNDLPLDGFWAALKAYMFEALDMKEYALKPEETAEVENLRETVYAQWSWNYGASPPCNMRKTRRIEGCGKIEILLDVEKQGIIRNIAFYGDFFGAADPDELAGKLTGRHLEYGELENVLRKTDVSRYFQNLDTENFLSLLLE
jgi:lipoate-protein ligase A